MQIVPAAISSPALTTHHSAGSNRPLLRWLFDHALEVARYVLPVIGERLLLRGVKHESVPVRIELDDLQPIRPHRRRRRRVELDTHLAKDAHGAIADRLEQAAGGGVRFVDAVLDPARTAGSRMPLELGREQLPDPASVGVGMDVALDAPQLTTVAHGTVREDTLAVADDTRVLHEVETRPLVLQIILRERARSLGVQRRLERCNDLGHRGGIPWHGRNDSDASHVVVDSTSRVSVGGWLQESRQTLGVRVLPATVGRFGRVAAIELDECVHE